MNLEQLTQYLVTVLAPEALNTGVEAMFWKSVFTLIVGVVMLIGAVISLRYLAWSTGKYGDKQQGKELVYTVLSFFGTLFLGVSSLVCLLNTWNWIGVVSPKSRLVLELLEAIK